MLDLPCLWAGITASPEPGIALCHHGGDSLDFDNQPFVSFCSRACRLPFEKSSLAAHFPLNRRALGGYPLPRRSRPCPESGGGALRNPPPRSARFSVLPLIGLLFRPSRRSACFSVLPVDRPAFPSIALQSPG
ncbi:hypothetical protein PAPYR_4819 [Paratrimastix pyriformis]|uniref:YHS domain-containing protein n=1 Tax=Paratrimastix pyriformis TaxID=342808 RepID=A0ABQ8UJ72_9EUKA|nr:hypothetical protein PAPYR_4819 [Paratrimastix pyriformis]